MQTPKHDAAHSHSSHSPFKPTDGHLHGEAPKITPEVIEANIIDERYFRAAEGVIGHGPDHINPIVTQYPLSLELLTFCVLTLRNGFTVVGKSACASPTNFDERVGRQVARGDAIRQIWPLMGYELRTQLHNAEQFGDSEVAEGLTRMIAHRLGNPESFRIQDAEAILAHFNYESDLTPINAAADDAS